MTTETINGYYKQAVETFELNEVNGEAFWATVSLILAEEGHVDKDSIGDVIECLSKLPAYASNMQKQMVACGALSEKAKATSLAARYLEKKKGNWRVQ